MFIAICSFPNRVSRRGLCVSDIAVLTQRPFGDTAGAGFVLTIFHFIKIASCLAMTFDIAVIARRNDEAISKSVDALFSTSCLNKIESI